MKFFDTDFYQLSMVYIYIMEGKANTIAGFEGFIRHIRPEITSNKYLLFEGSEEVINYINTIKEEFKSKDFIEEFIYLMKDKVVNFNESKFRKRFSELNFDFEWDVVKTNNKVYPYLPVFQFRGPVWIGQIIETAVTNCYNGRTGLNSTKNPSDYLRNIVHNDGSDNLFDYIQELKEKAKIFKDVAGDTPIFEAALRRSANKEIGYIASLIAIEAGWTATSNTALRKDISIDKIGGSMAHAFVMFFDSELEAFQIWDKYFPNTTILVDTYDTVNAIKTLIEYNIKPKDVRIDSGDLFKIPFEVRAILDNAGWDDVGIFLSGDISIEMIKDFKDKKVPVNKIMVGTKYIYPDEEIKKINSGFVYKIVEVHKNGEIKYPEKKAVGKKSYAGLKKITNKDGKTFVCKTGADEKIRIEEVLFDVVFENCF